jgi:hypothetical protein
MLRIEYESEGFPAGSPVANGFATLATDWDELLWSAITVGRPNRQFVFQHGQASMYEALFRLSLVRMAVEQSGPAGYRLRRTTAANSLDPSEKGAVNYFLGMAVCKLFAAKLLSAPWLVHLDVFRPQLNPQLSGRSRPDLIGQTETGQWLSFESKGRASTPKSDAKNKAKQQAERCISVNGTPLSYHIGGIMYFENDVLQFFWRDPTPQRHGPPNAIAVSLSDDAWRHYYLPVLELVRSDAQVFQRMLQEPILLSLAHLDIEVGIFPSVLKILSISEWARARDWCRHNASELDSAAYHRDGIRVIAGTTWMQPFVVPE